MSKTKTFDQSVGGLLFKESICHFLCLSGKLFLTCQNINRNACEGLRYKRPNCFTTQFHPEANAGPRDTEYLFNRFVASMGGDE